MTFIQTVSTIIKNLRKKTPSKPVAIIEKITGKKPKKSPNNTKINISNIGNKKKSFTLINYLLTFI